jgi:hypothetical protein
MVPPPSHVRDWMDSMAATRFARPVAALAIAWT